MLSPSLVSYIAAEIIPAGARVKFVSGSANRVELADAADIEIGTAILFSGKSSYAAESAVGVALVNNPGTRTVLADAGDITAGESIYRAADGKVADTGTSLFGVALEASAAANDNIEALLLSGVESMAPTVVGLTSTNGNATAAAAAVLTSTDGVALAVNSTAVNPTKGDFDALLAETEKIGDDTRSLHAKYTLLVAETEKIGDDIRATHAALVARGILAAS